MCELEGINECDKFLEFMKKEIEDDCCNWKK